MWRRGESIHAITIFYLVLLFWDVLIGVNFTINLHWIQRGAVVTGNACVAQAVIKQLSNTGAAMSIVAMSWCILHDFVFNSPRNLRARDAIIGIATMTLIQIIDILIPNAIVGANKYYGISGSWCWISKPYFPAKILTEYIFFWIACIFSLLTALVYASGVRPSAGYFWIGFPTREKGLLRVGLISFDTDDQERPERSFSVDMRTPGHTVSVMFPLIQYFAPRNDMPMDERQHGGVPNLGNWQAALNAQVNLGPNHQRFPFKLLLFPLAYFVLILPLSVVRFVRFTYGDASVPPIADPIVGSLYGLEGVVDTLLFLFSGVAFGINLSIR